MEAYPGQRSGGGAGNAKFIRDLSAELRRLIQARLKTADVKRIISMHLRDVDQTVATASGVVWGSGVLDIPGVLAELKRQCCNGLLLIEFDENGQDRLPGVIESVRNYQQMVKELDGK